MKSLAYTIPTTKSFDDVVAAIKHNTAAHGFRVLHVHDIAAALAEKGFQREPLKIIEICNAKYAHDVLEKDPTAALMLPCPIVVYQQNGEIKISTMLPSVIADLLPGKGLEFTAELVEFALLSIVNDSVEEPIPLPVS